MGGGGTYAWDNSATQGGSVSPSATTTYTVTVTAANGCTATDDVVVTVDKTNPTANAGSDATVTCSSPSTTLTATGGGTYNWNNSATQGGSVSPSATTTYTVTVTAANGCTATDDVIITVDKANPTASAGADATITCSSPSTMLTATATPPLGGGGTYAWDNSATQGGSVSPSATTTYTVTVTAANGCTTTDDVVVTVDKTNPTANAGADATVTCSSPSTTLTATGGGTYNWDNGATQGGSVSPSATTTYTVTVTAANGCTATDDVVVTVDKVLPTANAGADATVTCSSPSTTLTATGGGTYNWDNSATQGGSVSPSATTTYVVTVTAANGCTATDDVVVTVDKTAPTLSVSPANVTVCGTATTSISATATGVSYLWSANAASAVTPTIIVAAGTYNVTVTSTTNGCTASGASTVTSQANPTAVASATPSTICTGESTAFSASGGTSYAWSSGQSVASFNASPSNTTNYVVTVTENGCSATTTITVTVKVPVLGSAVGTSNLTETCTVNGWTYYADPVNTNELKFAIEWQPTGSTYNNASAKTAAGVSVSLDANPTSATDATDATYTMKRYWNVDLAGQALAGPVNVRFFYDLNEKAAIESAASAYAAANSLSVEAPTWFKTVGAAFNPATGLSPSSVANAIPLADENVGALTINGILYAEFENVTSFSGGTYSSGAGNFTPLPLSLIAYNAKKVGTTAQLRWITENESNIRSFIIEKSENGLDYQILTTQSAQGKASAKTTYTATDNTPFTGKNYYKLTVNEKDGSSRSLGVIQLDFAKQAGVTVYPNPVENTLYVTFDAATAAEHNINVIDINGRVVKANNFQAARGANLQALEVTDLPTGAYFIVITNENGERLTTQRFVKLQK